MKLLCLIIAMALMVGAYVPVCAADEQGAQKLLKEGLLGAAVGGIAASASDGDAGKGALIGAGTNIAGQAIMGALSGPSSQQTTAPAPQTTVSGTYSSGYQDGYSKGYQEGFQEGYKQGLQQPTFRE